MRFVASASQRWKRVFDSSAPDGMGFGTLVKFPDGFEDCFDALLVDKCDNCGASAAVKGAIPGLWEAGISLLNFNSLSLSLLPCDCNDLPLLVLLLNGICRTFGFFVGEADGLESSGPN